METKTKKRLKTLELLAPAKNLECGIAAIDHGADAVYIGAPRFGARAAAGNSLEDIQQLCAYAHQFGAKVHVTVNTIIYEDELHDTLEMICQLDNIGVDALLLQDMGVLQEVRAQNLWHHELHSSTQCDVRTPDKASWLTSLGFKRIVLARELSLKEIQSIHQAIPDSEIEVFVHGALCVCYSGVCYASEKCFSRSANRGECAQFCRMKFDLLDADGKEIEHQRHLLSLKDLCQIDYLKDLADAGACSFKIEGRLKDINYVKNVVSAYSQRLDEIVSNYPEEYRRASLGNVSYMFQPNLKKTFNRGYTHYFLNGRQSDIASFDTPKAIGEYVGKVKEMRGNISFNVATVASFMNGDGLCFINDEHELEGFRVNRVEGNRLYPFRMPENLRPGMALYRNNDRAFEGVLARKTAERRIELAIHMCPAYEADDIEKKSPIGVKINATVMIFCDIQGGYGVPAVEFVYDFPLQSAKRPQRDNIVSQLSKLGDTIYDAYIVDVLDGMENYFVPNSVLSIIRRSLVEKLNKLTEENIIDHSLTSGMKRTFSNNGYELNQIGEHQMKPREFVWQPEYGKWSYLYNIANFSAYDFYRNHGLTVALPAFELGEDMPLSWSATSAEDFEEKMAKDKTHRLSDRKVYASQNGESLLMQCRHCIRYSLGYCVKNGGQTQTWKEPLYLRLGDDRRFRLEFVCKECQMNIFSEKS